MKQLDIRLLGSLQIKRGESPLTNFESNKVRALMAYLVVEAEQPHQRRKLSALLWPEIPETKALSNLRYALSNLRKVIGDRDAQPPYLIITPQTIQFNCQSHCQVDVNIFEHYCQLAVGNPLDLDSLRKAADCYDGRFLEGFAIPDSISFEEWIVLKRERFNRMAYQVFHQLADDFEVIGDYASAIIFSAKQIELEPWREEAHRQFMRCLYFVGQRSAAVAQYESCRQALIANLGIKPSLATQHLFELIRDENLPLPQEPPLFFLPSESLSYERPSFVCREAPLARLHSALNKAMGGEGQIILVTGSPGQGKTALIHEFIYQALDQHPALAAAWGNSHAYFGSGDPFLPFREVLEMLSGQVEHRWESGSITHDHARRLWRLAVPCAQVLVEKSPALIGTFVSGHSLFQRVSHVLKDQPAWLLRLQTILDREYEKSPATMEAFWQQYDRAVDGISRQVPLILFIDDLQWADQSSLGLFFHLSRGISNKRILLLGSFRPMEENSSEFSAIPSMDEMINELRLRHGDILMDLDELIDRRFIDAYLDQEPNLLSEAFREKLFQYTSCHPLYTVEILFSMKERCDIRKNKNGKLVASESLDWDYLPSRIEAAIKERLDHLPRDLFELLKTASVEGERFTVEVVAMVQGKDEEQVLAKFRQRLDHQYKLVKGASSKRVDGHRLSRYRFRHILFQKYLYSHLDVVERAGLHEKVGRAMEVCYQGVLDEISISLAIHFERAGLPNKAISYHNMAGKRAILFSSYDDAIGHFKKALAIVDQQLESEDRNNQEIELLMNLSVPLMFKSGFASSELNVVSNRIVELLDILPLKITMFPTMHTLTQYYGLRAEYKQTLEVLEFADRLAKMSGDPLYFSLCDWGYGFLKFLLGKFEESLFRLTHMVNFYDPQKHQNLRFRYGNDPGVASRIWSAWDLWLLGYPDQGILRCQEALDLSKRLDDPANQLLAQIMTTFLLLLMKKTQNVPMLLQSCRSLLDQYPGAIYAVNFQFLEGFYRFQKGEKVAGLAEMWRSVEAYQEMGNHSMLSFYFVLIAEGNLSLAEVSQAEKMQQSAEDFITETDERFYESEVSRIKGELMETGNDIEKAERCFLQSLQISRHQNAKTLELRAATSLARLWGSQGRVEEAFQVLSEVYNWFTEGFDTADLKEAFVVLEWLGEKFVKEN